MAEDIRDPDPADGLTDERARRLVAECRRQEESCLFTSTMLYIWLRETRLYRRIFVIAPIVLGALAGWSVLDQPDAQWLKWMTAIFAFLAGLFPAIFEALKLDIQIDEIVRQAATFKALQDRFRQAATVTALGPFDEFQAEVTALMDRMDAARATSITPPERCFEAARKKIAAGHYDFAVDGAVTPPPADAVAPPTSSLNR
jgi:hypothetical protein